MAEYGMHLKASQVLELMHDQIAAGELQPVDGCDPDSLGSPMLSSPTFAATVATPPVLAVVPQPSLVLAAPAPSDPPTTSDQPTRAPITVQKAGAALEEFDTVHGITLVEIDDDGNYKLCCEDDGSLKNIEPKVWRRLNSFQKAAIHRLRKVHAENVGRNGPPRAQPSTTASPGGTPRPPPPPPPPTAPLPPLASGGLSAEQISAMMDTMRTQNDTLMRNQDQQAATNAQIMSSVAYLADAVKQQLQLTKPAPAEEANTYQGFEYGT